MTGSGIRWWWLTLAGRRAVWTPVVVLVAAWAVFLADWVTVEIFYSWCAVGLAAALVAWSARLSLYVRRALTRWGARWP